VALKNSALASRVEESADRIPSTTRLGSASWTNIALMKLSLAWPLIAFVVPTLIVGFGFVIPRSCIAGINELTIGFGSTVAGACLTYWLGLKAARRHKGK